MLPPHLPIEADGLSTLVYQLAVDGFPNDTIAAVLDLRVSKVEEALRAIRDGGTKLDRPAMNIVRMHRLFGIGSVVSVNLRSITAHYETLEHPEPAVVAARRIGKAIGRSEGWVNAVAAWYRKGVSDARIEFGGTLDESVAELRRQARKVAPV